MSDKYIVCKAITYNLPNNDLLFKNLNLDLAKGEKAALIGDNGCGKSSLFKIISGEFAPTEGDIKRNARIFYLPQNLEQFHGKISDILALGSKIESLKRISSGTGEERDWEKLEHDWNIEEKFLQELNDWNLNNIDLNGEFANLSGGEKEKLLLIDALLSNAEIILLDEPTNNLDGLSRELLLQKMNFSSQGFLIISHDRKILDNVSSIWEMSDDGIIKFGGNYQFYLQEKKRNIEAVENKLKSVRQSYQKISVQKKEMETQKSRKIAYGEKQVANKRYTKIQGNAMRSNAQKNQAIRLMSLNQKLKASSIEADELSFKLRDETIKIPLPTRPFIKDKLVEIKDLDFSYSHKKIFQNYNLVIKGGEKIALCGNNGCGKTTLIRLILGDLKPVKGSLKLMGKAVYLNQDLSLLNKNLSLIDNLLALNRGLTLNDVHKTLANFKFRNKAAEKLVKNLSGGEVLRGCLAAIFCNSFQPDIIILDEPTNNLDLKSIDVLEQALTQYQGALLVVSHDEDFIKNINIERKVFF